MRLVVGTAAVCVLVAFGAAFLVARAVIHQPTARAATLTHVAATPSARIPATSDPELGTLFAPQLGTLRLQVVHHVRRHTQHTAPTAPAATSAPARSASPPSSSASATGSSATASTDTPSAVSEPYVAPVTHSSDTGSGAGTTSIGGSGSDKSGGSGKTTIG